MYVISVTIATTNLAQPVVPAGVTYRNKRFQAVIPQNRGTNNMYLGDQSITTGNSLLFSPTGSLGSAIQPMAGISDLQDFWVLGTAGDTMVFMVFE